jgi:hypothetical protein
MSNKILQRKNSISNVASSQKPAIPQRRNSLSSLKGQIGSVCFAFDLH